MALRQDPELLQLHDYDNAKAILKKNNVALDHKASLSAKEDSNKDYKLFENSVYLGTQTLLKGGIEKYNR